MPYEESQLIILNETERSYARALLTELHNRHVGMPVRVVPGLVKLLTAPIFPSQVLSPWKEVFTRLLAEIRPDQPRGTTRPARPMAQAGLSWGAAPTYVIRRIVVPLVEAACLEINKCLLLSEDESIAQDILLPELELYEKKIVSLIQDFAKVLPKDPRFDLFWKERAAALFTFSSASRSGKTLPDPEPLSTGFLLRLDALPKSARKYEHLKRIHLRYSKHRSRQLREEGLAGIVQTRSPEMIQRMILSEMINPYPVLVDRVLNSGYLVTERLPRRERLRDALMITFLPPKMQVQPASDFLRACWLNATSLIYQALLNNHLHDSLLIWVEGTAMDRFNVTAVSLAEMRSSLMENSSFEVSHARVFRQGFIHQAQLLPQLIDRRREPTYISVEDNELPADSAQWVYRVWETPFIQKRRIPSAKSMDGMEKIIEEPMQLKTLVQKFAYVHVMSLLSLDEIPEQDQGDPQASNLALRLAQNIYSDEHKGFYHSETWMHPQNFKQGKADEPLCQFTGAFQRCPIHWSGEQPAGDFVAAAQALEQVWVEEIIQEMQRE